MAGEEAQRILSPQPAVNNFARRENCAARFGWCASVLFTIRVLWFSAPAGQACNDPVAPTTLSFIDRPAGRPCALNDYSRGRHTVRRLFYIAVAGSRRAEDRQTDVTQKAKP